MHNYGLDISCIKSERDFQFSEHTTYGLGGKAKIAYFPKTALQAEVAFEYVQDNYENYVILGNGSNVLASDGDFNGAVISTKCLSGVELDGNVLKCLSGTTVGELLRFCKQNALSGLEYLAGIPATVGGLALMNGGINYRHVESDIFSVTVFDEKIREISNKNCNFGNKHSIMRNINAIILEVGFTVYKSCESEVENKIKEFLSRRQKLPKGRSCGCVFKNPIGGSAGELIDEAGLKGLKMGNAEVSREHANFILNKGATAADVRRLIEIVKRKVYENSGIKLEEEVVYIGEFNGIDC